MTKHFKEGGVVLGFKKLLLKPEYRSFEDDITNDFYVPVLKETFHYKRAVGYFSSTALIEITKGLKGLVNNSGKIQIIASPQLSEEDVNAIELGYKHRDQVISESIVRNLDLDTEDYFKKKRLNILASLISNNVLDIKIAFIETEQNIGIYHEKMGIVTDKNNNKIVFTGSLNETKSALSYNYESFDVFCSWKNEMERIQSKERAFDSLWNNEANKVRTIEFPNVARAKLEDYIFEEPDFSVDDKNSYGVEGREGIEKYQIESVGPRYPSRSDFSLRNYQKDAIENWSHQEFKGVFDMATGTGKTITGLAAATELFKSNNKRLAIVIVCPYQHLVEQWVEDIELFNMNPIIGYSASKQRKWRENLKTSIEAFNYKLTNHFCFVTTNATFSIDPVQKLLKRLEGDFLLIIDEAHNFGARHLATSLLDNANYRLALSATLDRHNDEEGTNALYNYFGEKCIEYTLKEAIDNNMLTPYEYYPIPVYLIEDELKEYTRLTAEISKRITKDRNGKVKFKDSAKHFLIQRARLIAGASNKLEALKAEIINRKDESNILVYCGATTISDPDYEENNPLETEVRQIDAVTNILGNELGMYVAKFTSQEDANERENLKERFANNEFLQALIAIRCLDEGVNIPSVQTAYILASSTNPKEYVQRRGRVLRLYEGKDKAVIYDFITLPASLEDMQLFNEQEIRTYRGLVQREVTRMRDFASIALNSSEADFLIYDLETLFNLTIEGIDSNNEQFI